MLGNKYVRVLRVKGRFVLGKVFFFLEGDSEEKATEREKKRNGK